MTIDTGEFTDSEIIVMLGENGNDSLLLFIYLFIYLFVTGQPIICVTVSLPRKTFDIVAQPKGKISSSCSTAVSTLCDITVATIALVVFVVIITQSTL